MNTQTTTQKDANQMMQSSNIVNSHDSQKEQRGFATMDREKQKAIASKGGRAAHEKGTAHKFTPEEARVAGRKGGEVVSKNRDHMAAIGREGGMSSHRGRGRSGAQQPDPTPGHDVF